MSDQLATAPEPKPQPKRRRVRKKVDRLEEWQYLTFRVTTFVIFVASALQFLDHHIYLRFVLGTLYEYVRRLFL